MRRVCVSVCMNSVEALTNLSTHQKLWFSFVHFLSPQLLGLWSKMQFPFSSCWQSAFILRTTPWESQNASKHTRTSSWGHQRRPIGKTVYCRIEHLPISINCHQPHIFRLSFPVSSRLLSGLNDEVCFKVPLFSVLLCCWPQLNLHLPGPNPDPLCFLFSVSLLYCSLVCVLYGSMHDCLIIKLLFVGSVHFTVIEYPTLW